MANLIFLSDEEVLASMKKAVKEKETELRNKVMADEPAKALYALYTSLKNEGFSDEQAFELVKITVQMQVRK